MAWLPHLGTPYPTASSGSRLETDVFPAHLGEPEKVWLASSGALQIFQGSILKKRLF